MRGPFNGVLATLCFCATAQLALSQPTALHNAPRAFLNAPAAERTAFPADALALAPEFAPAPNSAPAPSPTKSKHGKKHAKSQAPSPSDGTDTACCAMLEAINFKSELPVVIVDTGLVNVTRNATASHLCTCSQGLEKGDLDAHVEFRIRGGTNSQLRNKVFQYAAKANDKKHFLGLPKSRKWIFYAQQLDVFGLHNWLGFNLTRGTGQYATKTQFCELFIVDDGMPLNNETHYRGIYVAMQKPDQGKSGVDIADNDNPKDISGGYMLEFKHAQNPDNLPTVNGSVTQKQWNLEYPEAKNISQEQIDYIQKYVDSFEEALYMPGFSDPLTGWRKYADEKAFVDWFLASELIRNVKHTYHSSAWMHKDANSTLKMGPVWDNVQGFGTCCGYPVNGFENGGASAPNPASGGNGVSSSGWLFSVCENGNCQALDKYAPGYGISTWFQQLWKDPIWVQACATRYAELRAGNWSDERVGTSIASLKPLLHDAALRTLARWPKELAQPKYFPTFEAQFEFTVSHLSDWTIARMKWMDSAFKQALIPGEAQGPYPSTYPSLAPIAAALPVLAG